VQSGSPPAKSTYIDLTALDQSIISRYLHCKHGYSP